MSVDLTRQLSYLLRSSLVRRYHNRRLHVEDTVGRHSYLVAWLCYLLADGAPSAALLLAALAHDAPEAVTGDLTAPVKRLLNAGGALDALEAQVHARLGLQDFNAALTPEERATLKLADTLEGWLFSHHEVKGLGNFRLMTVRTRYGEYLNALLPSVAEPLRTRATQVFRAAAAILDNPNEDEEDVCL